METSHYLFWLMEVVYFVDQVHVLRGLLSKWNLQRQNGIMVLSCQFVFRVYIETIHTPILLPTSYSKIFFWSKFFVSPLSSRPNYDIQNIKWRLCAPSFKCWGPGFISKSVTVIRGLRKTCLLTLRTSFSAWKRKTWISLYLLLFQFYFSEKFYPNEEFLRCYKIKHICNQST